MLEIRDISKSYPGFSLERISFDVGGGGYFTLIGPSGSGKSLLLAIIAGFVRQDQGSVLKNGLDIGRLEPHRRGIGLLFQKGYVFPHMNVERNIGFPLFHKRPGKSVSEIVAGLAKKFDLEHLLHRYPQNLSGGELQRVALARVMAMDPGVLLLDEPLSSLDVQFKYDFRNLLKRINDEGKSIVHVTHDYEEALRLATHVGIIREGRLIQQGGVEEVFGNPRSEFAANFIGYRNFFRVRIAREGDSVFGILSNGLKIRMLDNGDRGKGFIIIDQRDIILSHKPLDSSARNCFPGKVASCQRISGGCEVVVDCGVDFHVIVSENSLTELGIEPGSELYVAFKAASVRLISDGPGEGPERH